MNGIFSFAKVFYKFKVWKNISLEDEEFFILKKFMQCIFIHRNKWFEEV